MHPVGQDRPSPRSDELTPRQVRTGLRWNIAAGCMTMVWLVLPGTPLTLLMESMGAEGFQVGLMVSLQQAAMMLQLPGALLSDRFRRRKALWATLSLLHRGVWFLPITLVFSPDWALRVGPRLIVVMVGVSSVFAQLSVSSWHAWMADLIPEAQRSRFWGLRQSILWVVYLPAVLLFGYLLDLFPDPRQLGGHYGGFALVFALGGLAGCLDVILHLRVPEPAIERPALRTNLARRFFEPFRNRDFTFLTLSMTAWHFSLGMIGAFGILYLSRAFGLSYTQLAILGVSASLAGILSGFLWGYLIKRTGARSFCVAVLMVIPLFGGGWFLLRHEFWTLPLPLLGVIRIYQPVLVQFVMSFLGGMFFSGVGLCQLNLLAILTPRADRTFAMAGHWTAVGFGSALGPLLAGRIVDSFDARWPLVFQSETFQFSFMHLLILLQVAVVWLLVLPLMAAIRNRSEDLPVGATLARLFVGNPLRLMGNILLMDTATTPRGRIRAARGVGRQRFLLAADDLIAQLDNPITAVREASVTALGRIGGSAALRALAAELAHPHSGLTLPLLGALGASGDPAAVSIVLPWLRHGESEVVRQALRALARLRDAGAVPEVLALLESASRPELVVACGETLQALGAVEAAPLLLRRLPAVDDHRQKRILAVAIADLVTPPGAFYRMLDAETRHPGTLFDMLFEALAPPSRLRTRPWRRRSAALPSPVLEAIRGAIARGAAHEAAAALRSGLREAPSDSAALLASFLDRLLEWPPDAARDRDWLDCELPLALYLAGALPRR